MSQVVVDPESGRVALTRRELDTLARIWSGREQRVDPDVVVQLEDAGAVTLGKVHPMLEPVLHTVASLRARAALRRWLGGYRPIVEIMVGDTGLVVLPGGHELSAQQELRWLPRPSTVARVVWDLLDLPVLNGPGPFDDTPRRWSDLTAAASDPDSGVALADLRWSAGRNAPFASVLVLVWHHESGISTVEPDNEAVNGADGQAIVRCRPHGPLDVWAGLTVLAADVTS